MAENTNRVSQLLGLWEARKYEIELEIDSIKIDPEIIRGMTTPELRNAMKEEREKLAAWETEIKRLEDEFKLRIQNMEAHIKLKANADELKRREEKELDVFKDPTPPQDKLVYEDTMQITIMPTAPIVSKENDYLNESLKIVPTKSINTITRVDYSHPQNPYPGTRYTREIASNRAANIVPRVEFNSPPTSYLGTRDINEKAIRRVCVKKKGNIRMTGVTNNAKKGKIAGNPIIFSYGDKKYKKPCHNAKDSYVKKQSLHKYSAQNILIRWYVKSTDSLAGIVKNKIFARMTSGNANVKRKF